MDHNLAAEVFYLLDDITRKDPSLLELTVAELKWRTSHVAFAAVSEGKTIDKAVTDHANNRSKAALGGSQSGT